MKWKFARFGFALMLKFGRVGGSVGLVIVCTACVPLEKLFGIPPPLQVKKCVGGTLSVTAKKACPIIPLTISGNGERNDGACLLGSDGEGTSDAFLDLKRWWNAEEFLERHTSRAHDDETDT